MTFAITRQASLHKSTSRVIDRVRQGPIRCRGLPEHPTTGEAKEAAREHVIWAAVFTSSCCASRSRRTAPWRRRSRCAPCYGSDAAMTVIGEPTAVEKGKVGMSQIAARVKVGPVWTKGLNKEVQEAAAVAQLKLDRQRLFKRQLQQHLESKQQQQLLRRKTKQSRCVAPVSAV